MSKQDELAAFEALPPLPEPALMEGVTLSKVGSYPSRCDGYTADQMRAYARAALSAAWGVKLEGGV